MTYGARHGVVHFFLSRAARACARGRYRSTMALPKSRMVLKAGEQGHQAMPLTADGRQAQHADGLEAVLDGGPGDAVLYSEQVKYIFLA